MKEFLPVLIDRHRHSALGVLAKGIIHNLNGSLQVLSMHMELLQRMAVKEGGNLSSSVDEKIRKCFEQIEKMKGMLALLQERAAHSDRDDYRSICLNDLLEEEIGLLHHHLFFKHEVKVRKDFSPNLPLNDTAEGRYQNRRVDFVILSLKEMENEPQLMELVREEKESI